MKIYGPYLRKDGRQHVVIKYADGTLQTKSYPRLLLEERLGRLLTEDETVDHIDGNFTNNSYENLRILSRSQNASYGWITGNCFANIATEEFCKKQSLLKQGCLNGMSKLENSQVCDLRSRKKFHGCITEWSLEFNVTIKTIRNILNNKSYQNVN